MSDRPAWSARVLEGVTIVLSILAAFALDSWWDTRQAAGSLDAGLSAVSDELVRSGDHLTDRVRVYDRVDAYLTAAVEMLASRPTGSVVEIPDTLMAAVLYAPTIDPPTGALRGFLDSGLLTSVSDEEIRRRVASLPSRYEDGADDELVAADYVQSRVRPMLERTLSGDEFVAVLGQIDHYWSRMMPSTPWRTPITTVRVVKTDELQNLFSSRLQMLRLARGEVATLAATVEGTVALLGGPRR